jgi:hypothetical protein
MRPSAQLATARALRWREGFPAFCDQHPSYAPDYLRRRQTLPPATRLAHQPPEQRPARRHQLPGQAAKARARDYRDKTKMITIVYLTAAKLPFPPSPAQHPHQCSHAE